MSGTSSRVFYTNDGMTTPTQELADDDRNSFGRNELRFYIPPSKRDTYVHTSKSDDFPCRFVTAHPLNTGVAVL